MSFAIREPAVEEIRKVFGTVEQCLAVTKGDLPTILHFLSNPDRLAGFKAPKSARRVGYGSYAKRLREWVKSDRKTKRDILAAGLRMLVEERLDATWSDGRPVHDRAKPLRLGALADEVRRIQPFRPVSLTVTRKTVREAVEVINARRRDDDRWLLPATRPRNTPAARDRAMRGVRR